MVGAGGFVILPSGGTVEVGSVEGAGAIHLGHGHLRTGGLNTSTTISGPITGFVTNPRLTKIGTGTLTLTGANTYIGPTKVDGGTLVINGSTPGSVEVNNGTTLKGTGTIGGTVTVNSGGMLRPGFDRLDLDRQPRDDVAAASSISSSAKTATTASSPAAMRRSPASSTSRCSAASRLRPATPSTSSIGPRRPVRLARQPAPRSQPDTIGILLNSTRPAS